MKAGAELWCIKEIKPFNISGGYQCFEYPGKSLALMKDQLAKPTPAVLALLLFWARYRYFYIDKPVYIRFDRDT